MNYTAQQTSFYSANNYSQNSPTNSYRSTVRSNKNVYPSSYAAAKYYVAGSQKNERFDTDNSLDQGSSYEVSRKKSPLKVDTNLLGSKTYTGKFLKDNEVLSKANEVLERSARLGKSNLVPDYGRSTPVIAQTNSSSSYPRNTKAFNVLAKADQILQRSIKDYTPVTVPDTSNRTPLTYQESSFGGDRQTPTPTLPGESKSSKTFSILSKVDEALQKSFQITSTRTNIPQVVRHGRGLAQEPQRKHEIQSEYNSHRRSVSQDRIQKDLTKYNQEITTISNTYQSPTKNGSRGQEILDKHEVVKRSAYASEPQSNVKQNPVESSPIQPQPTPIQGGTITLAKSPPRVYMPNPTKKPKFADEYYEDGSTYRGEKIKALKQGRGELVFPDGSKYDGEWEKDRKSGYGIKTFANGNIEYDGEWKDDLYHGNGILMNEDAQFESGFDYRDFSSTGSHWVKFEGEFIAGKMHGMGTLTLYNNERYVGKFQYNKVHGPGVFHKTNGDSISAEWDNNKLIRVL